MISVGCGFGGPGLPQAPIGRLLLAASQLVQKYRGDYPEGSIPEVNVVFYVPGCFDDFPSMTRIAAGRFSRKQKLLLVEVPVPREVADSGGTVQFVVDALREANAIAADVFARKDAGSFDRTNADAIVERVRYALLTTNA